MLIRQSHALQALRDALESTGFAAASLQLARDADALPVREFRAPAALLHLEERLEKADGVLLALFSVGAPLEREHVARVLPAVDLGALEELAMVRSEGSRVTPTVRIETIDHLFIAADRDISRADQVMGLSPSTRTAAAYTPHVGGASAFDLGTGAGPLALHMARYSASVVASDVNARALSRTELNARLNGLKNVEVREGSLFEPVAGERFDLIAANPPYVISPEQHYVYRDAGRPGDELSRTVLTQLPGFLSAGGMAAVQANWIHRAADPWWQPIEQLLHGNGCDAFIVRLATETPLEYALFWSASGHSADHDGFAAEARQRRADLQRQGVERITTAMVVLRRRADERRPCRVAATLMDVPTMKIGGGLPELFDAQDRLSMLDDDALLDAPLHVSAGFTVHDLVPAEAGGTRCTLEAPGALPVRRRVDSVVAGAALRLDGERPLRMVLDPDERHLVDDFRALVQLGFLKLR